MKSSKRKNRSRNRFIKGQVNRNMLESGRLPEPLLTFIHDTFKAKNEKEIAYLACRMLYGNIANEHFLSVSSFLEVGYSRSSYGKALKRLISCGLVLRTRNYSKKNNLMAKYRFNIVVLKKLLKRSERNLKGIHGKITKRSFRIQSQQLKKAVAVISLYWSQSNAIDYCSSLPCVGDRSSYLNSMRYMSEGFIKPSWKEVGGVLYASHPSLNIKRGLWQRNIVGNGKKLYSVDLEACYPNLTAVFFNNRLCSKNPYKTFVQLMKAHGTSIDEKNAKADFNKLLNGGELNYKSNEELDAIKKIVLESMEITNVDFKTVVKVQSEIRRLGGVVMSLALIKAVECGITDLLPIVDGFYTTNTPEVVKEIIQEASREVLGCELPVKIKVMPVFEKQNK